MHFRGIIFDLDGTLADTLSDIGDAMNRVLAFRGYPSHPLDKYKLFIGNGIENLVRTSLPRGVSDDLVEECRQALLNDYSTNCLVKTRLYAGISGLLNQLSERRLAVSVLSNKDHDLTLKIVAALAPGFPFVSVLGARDGIPRKPDPAGALLIGAKTGIPAHEMLYAGDTDVDMQTAVRAGMFAIGCLWGFRSAGELEQSGAAALVQNPGEILHFF